MLMPGRLISPELFLISRAMTCALMIMFLGGCAMKSSYGGRWAEPTLKETRETHQLQFPSAPVPAGAISFKVISASATSTATVFGIREWRVQMYVDVINSKTESFLFRDMQPDFGLQFLENGKACAISGPFFSGPPWGRVEDGKMNGYHFIKAGATGRMTLTAACDGDNLFKGPIHLKVKDQLIPLTRP